MAALPCLGTGIPVHPQTLLTILKVSTARIGLIAAAAIFFAYFAAYTYINPLLQSRAGLTGEQVTVVLLGFGLAGGATNFGAGVTVRRHLPRNALRSWIAHCRRYSADRCHQRNAPRRHRPRTSLGSRVRCGPRSRETWMARTMPASVEGGLALFVSALQGSLAAGSAVGGLLFNTYGTTAPLVLAAVIAAGGSLVLVGRSAKAVDIPAGSEA